MVLVLIKRLQSLLQTMNFQGPPSEQSICFAYHSRRSIVWHDNLRPKRITPCCEIGQLINAEKILAKSLGSMVASKPSTYIEYVVEVN